MFPRDTGILLDHFLTQLPLKHRLPLGLGQLHDKPSQAEQSRCKGGGTCTEAVNWLRTKRSSSMKPWGVKVVVTMEPESNLVFFWSTPTWGSGGALGTVLGDCSQGTV